MANDPPLLPRAARRTAAWCAVALLVAGVGALAIWLCVVLRDALVPVLLALLGTALLGPLHRRLVRLGLSRSLAAGLTCLALVGVVGGAGYIVVSALIDSGDQIVDSVRTVARQIGDHLDLAGTSLDDLASKAKELVGKFGGSAASGLLSGLSVVGQLFAASVLALLLTFFFLRDSDRAARTLHTLAPRGTGPRVEAVARIAFGAVEGFMRGTTLIAFIDAVCITAGLLILRVPGAVGLGALVLVGAYIPYLGALISGTVAVLVALADRGFVIALWTVGVVLAVQLLEGHVLQPMIQSRTVQMHPAMVMVAITAGAGLAGILGMLLAVPIAAAAFGVLGALREAYEEGPEPSPSGEGPSPPPSGEGPSGEGPSGEGPSGEGPSAEPGGPS
ncbi:AI-2E family transporter [Streptomyces sp. NPDC001922]|uniref:AI-2E family transporter n=1 Tax=Streptomyces sp. NPDC001922 TaxID=3364624 RepID=UPI003692CCB7